MQVAESTEADYLQRQQNDLRESVRASFPDGDAMPLGIVKAAAKRADTLGTKIRGLRYRERPRDAGVTFEQLGIDYICLDEAHYYKNLALPCRTAGFTVKPSKRATDLDLKLAYLRKRSKQPFVTLFTGTPVSNTMLELYVIMHYLMPEYLASIGLGSADLWCAAYVQMQTKVEVTTNGGSFQLRTRPSLFVNAPELRLLLSMCADIRTAEQLGLIRPDVDERVIVVQPTSAQQAYSEELVERAKKVAQQGRRVQKGADNMLVICSHGRWMATDPKLVGIDDPAFDFDFGGGPMDDSPSGAHAAAQTLNLDDMDIGDLLEGIDDPLSRATALPGEHVEPVRVIGDVRRVESDGCVGREDVGVYLLGTWQSE